MLNLRRQLCLIVGSVALGFAAPVLAGDGGYVGVGGGYNWTRNMTFNYTATTNLNESSSAQFNSGYNLDARIGYKSSPLRYEGELAYYRSHASQLENSVNGQLTDPSGRLRTTAGMLNILYDFDKSGSPWVAYLGGGIGFARTSTHLSGQGVDGFLTAGTTTLAYQGLLGLDYLATDHLSLGVGYKLFVTGRGDYDVRDSTNTVIEAVHSRVVINNVGLNATYRF